MATTPADDKKDLWVAWTHDALDNYEAPDRLDDSDELVDDMVGVAVKYADSMLDEYEERFGGTAGKSRRRKRKLIKDDDDDLDED